MKKTGTMESMESDSHTLHMGKREVSMADDMMNTTETTTKTAITHHRKRSVSIFAFPQEVKQRS